MTDSTPLLMKAQHLRFLLEICTFSSGSGENQKKSGIDGEKIQRLFLRYSKHPLSLSNASALLRLLEGCSNQALLDELTFDIRYFIEATALGIECTYNTLGRAYLNEPWEAVLNRRREAEEHIQEYCTAFRTLCSDIIEGKVTLSDITQ